jgi:hypothetical protein
VQREGQMRSGRVWARIGQRGDVARGAAGRVGGARRVREVGRATIGGGDGGTGKRGCGVAALGVRSGLAGYSKRHRRGRGVTWHGCRRSGRRARSTEGWMTQALVLGARGCRGSDPGRR